MNSLLVLSSWVSHRVEVKNLDGFVSKPPCFCILKCRQGLLCNLTPPKLPLSGQAEDGHWYVGAIINSVPYDCVIDSPILSKSHFVENKCFRLPDYKIKGKRCMLFHYMATFVQCKCQPLPVVTTPPLGTGHLFALPI